MHKDVCISLVANCTYSAPDVCSPGVHCVYIKLTSTAGACLNGCVLCLYECIILRTFTERSQCIPILMEEFSGQQLFHTVGKLTVIMNSKKRSQAHKN